MSLSRYAGLVCGFSLLSLAAVWPFLADPASRRAVACGALLAVVNTVAAYALVVWSAARSAQVFLGAVLGGMVGRMGLLLGAVAVGVLRGGLPKVPLAVALLAYFVFFLVFEIGVLHKRTLQVAR